MRKFDCLVLLLIVFALATVRNEAISDDWSRIKDFNDSHVKEIANFAVTEYDRKSDANLKLESVIDGYTKEKVDGISYSLALIATNDSLFNIYSTEVWEKANSEYKKLISFFLVPE
ncbi:hypothetical protein VNO77_05988 [Canavalia gladiata]|uniref:Cystatin domain-containing protein n=1 Tax=Canavalia gladiata TaxID=3824 RepID=A0AAN9R651_CANGL